MAPGFSWGDGQKALFLINEGDEKFPNLRRLAVEEHKDPHHANRAAKLKGVRCIGNVVMSAIRPVRRTEKVHVFWKLGGVIECPTI
jgi:hypothetical protein